VRRISLKNEEGELIRVLIETGIDRQTREKNLGFTKE
jgi:hypothetical protein